MGILLCVSSRNIIHIRSKRLVTKDKTGTTHVCRRYTILQMDPKEPKQNLRIFRIKSKKKKKKRILKHTPNQETISKTED